MLICKIDYEKMVKPFIASTTVQLDIFALFSSQQRYRRAVIKWQKLLNLWDRIFTRIHLLNVFQQKCFTFFQISHEKWPKKISWDNYRVFLFRYILCGAVMCLLTYQSELLEETCCKNQYRSNGHKKPTAATKTAVN